MSRGTRNAGAANMVCRCCCAPLLRDRCTGSAWLSKSLRCFYRLATAFFPSQKRQIALDTTCAVLLAAFPPNANTPCPRAPSR